MRIIKLSAIDSTNNYLKDISRKESLEDEVVVWANAQIQGRGQRGAGWFSEADQSLTFSIFKRFSAFETHQHFVITMAVSLGVKRALDLLKVDKVSIKWPNDILADGKKVCGILIENTLSGDQITSSVVGIGLNVNNTNLQQLPRASSLKIENKKDYILEEVFQQVLLSITEEMRKIGLLDFKEWKDRYEAHLFRKEKISVFELNSSKRCNGIIKGVSEQGALRVQLEDDSIKTFQLKELKMLY